MTAPTTPHPATNRPEPPRPESLHDVPGWFYRADILLFDWFLRRQQTAGIRGDLLELGSYMGKSAVLMPAYLENDESFTVCDLFGSDAPDAGNQRETSGSYDSLTRQAFEANYLSFHDELPRILQAPTSVVPEEVTSGSCRFVHVDASHLYEHVRSDIANARKVLVADGLLVLDDYRSSHTPGVACATWQAVVEDGLRPVCVTNNKFYGTWGDPGPLQQELYDALEARGDCWLQWQQVAGRRLLLMGGKHAALPELPASRHAKTPEEIAREKAAEEAAEEAEKERKAAEKAAEKAARERAAAEKRAEAERRARRPRARVVRAAKDVLPPVLTRTVVRARKRRRSHSGS